MRREPRRAANGALLTTPISARRVQTAARPTRRGFARTVSHRLQAPTQNDRSASLGRHRSPGVERASSIGLHRRDLDPRDRDALLTAIAKARSWMDDLIEQRVQSRDARANAGARAPDFSCRNEWTSARKRASLALAGKGFGPTGILPRWRRRHCGALAVTAKGAVASQRIPYNGERQNFWKGQTRALTQRATDHANGDVASNANSGAPARAAGTRAMLRSLWALRRVRPARGTKQEAVLVLLRAKARRSPPSWRRPAGRTTRSVASLRRWCARSSA